MMSALEFIKGFRRMCKENANCPNCPLYQCDLDCGQILSIDPIRALDNADVEQVVNLVEKWNIGHSVKTHLTEIQKIFPHITEDDCPGFLNIKSLKGECFTTNCTACRAQFWNTEI